MTNVAEVLDRLANSKNRLDFAQRLGGMKSAYGSNPQLKQTLESVEAIIFLNRQRKFNGIGDKTMHRR